MTEEKYVIHCPKCKSTFDVKKYLDEWKKKIIESTGILKEIKELIKDDN